MYAEAGRRGWSRAQRRVVIGDGAEWTWNLAEQWFPGTILIRDLYQARQHLWDLTRTLYPRDDLGQKRWRMPRLGRLESGKLDAVVAGLRSIPAAARELADTLRLAADSFPKNARRMRYPVFRRAGWFIGSGVIEVGCKTVIGSRLKQSGVF